MDLSNIPYVGSLFLILSSIAVITAAQLVMKITERFKTFWKSVRKTEDINPWLIHFVNFAASFAVCLAPFRAGEVDEYLLGLGFPLGWIVFSIATGIVASGWYDSNKNQIKKQAAAVQASNVSNFSAKDIYSVWNSPVGKFAMDFLKGILPTAMIEMVLKQLAPTIMQLSLQFGSTLSGQDESYIRSYLYKVLTDRQIIKNSNSVARASVSSMLFIPLLILLTITLSSCALFGQVTTTVLNGIYADGTSLEYIVTESASGDLTCQTRFNPLAKDAMGVEVTATYLEPLGEDYTVIDWPDGTKSYTLNYDLLPKLEYHYLTFNCDEFLSERGGSVVYIGKRPDGTDFQTLPE